MRTVRESFYDEIIGIRRVYLWFTFIIGVNDVAKIASVKPITFRRLATVRAIVSDERRKRPGRGGFTFS